MRTGFLLDLIGTNIHALHRYAAALDEVPVVQHGRGGPHEWSPGACATIYTAFLLSHDVRDGVAGNIYPARAVGAAYAATWPTAPADAPTWAACGHHTAFLALSAAACWHAAMPLTQAGAVVRIVPLSPLKEALMADPDLPRSPYVVTFGLTRRLVEAEDPDAAMLIFVDEVARPKGYSVAADELVIRPATPDDLDEFAEVRVYKRPK